MIREVMGDEPGNVDRRVLSVKRMWIFSGRQWRVTGKF